MMVAATNALSYFFRSQSISDLLDKDPRVTEAVGFPFEIWREGSVYHGTMIIDYVAAGYNLLTGVALGTIFGVIAIALSGFFNNWVVEFERKAQQQKPVRLQFSTRGLMILTSIAAVLIAIMTQWHGTREVLMAIYFAGPLVLILIAMSPSNIRWQHRIVILTLLAIAMIGIALSSGVARDVSMDKVLLGIFVSWTPQSAFAAMILMVYLVTSMLWRDIKKAPNSGQGKTSPLI